MGGRVSLPRYSDGLTEASRPTRPRFNIKGRSLTAPLAAATMACLLLVYARTSIHAARLNAQRHREADGGQVNWRNESLRRHGQLEKLDDKALLKEALMGDKDISTKTAHASHAAAKRRVEATDEPAKALEDFKTRQRAGIARDDD